MAHLKGGNELFASIDDRIISSTKKVLLQDIEFMEVADADNEASRIYSKYKPINTAYNFKKNDYEQKEKKQIQRQASADKENSFCHPKVILYPPEMIEMNWKELKRIGPGFANLGNTCFLNSVLQVLTYTAPLVNFINSDAHRNKCASVGFCMLCEFRNHIIRVAKHHPQNGPIRPMSIIQRLSCISKNFKFGRQEDAHEFLRYVIEALRKSCLVGKTNLDRLSKETTAVNQIFGGFFRSQVTCLACKNTSSTYDPMMELNLDIKEANSVSGALKNTIRTEKLDGENKYFCEKCNRKAVALKRCNIHTAPKILTVQLKRFDFQRLFGGKISKGIQFPEALDLSPFMSSKSETQVFYKLYAVLVHSGISCNSGHYYCYVKAPNGTWYEMNDSRVSQVGLQTVLRAQAYLLFYARTGHQSSKVPKQEVMNHVKSHIVNGKSNTNQGKQTVPSVAKDIGISIVRKEPRIVPLSANRDKVNFSFTGDPKKRIEVGLKEKAKSNAFSPLQLKTKDNVTEEKSSTDKSSSLEEIRKVYDSSDSEADVTTPEKSKGKEPAKEQKTALKSQRKSMESKKIAASISEIVTEEERTVASTEEQHSDIKKDLAKDGSKVEESRDETAVAEHEGNLLSTPKSANTEALHLKRKLKMHTGTPLSTKIGRWVPVKGLGSSFTPRPVLHRSLSDSLAFDKCKASAKDLKRQMSTQVQATPANDKSEKATPWSVGLKETLEIPYGPMTPPVKPANLDGRLRERTSSVTSETGSITKKTGDWEVHEKELDDTLAPPYIPERHFAGWSVQRTSERESKTKHSMLENSVHSSRERIGVKQTPKDDDIPSSRSQHKKNKKDRKRRESEKLRLEDESEAHCKAKKRRRSEDEDCCLHKDKKKSKKVKKKKKRRHYSDGDEEPNTERRSSKEQELKSELKEKDHSQKHHKKSSEHERDAASSPGFTNRKMKSVDAKEKIEASISKEKKDKPVSTVEGHTRKKKKKKKKSSSLDTKKAPYDREDVNGDDHDSRYAAVKAPRRVSLITLGNKDNNGHDALKAKENQQYSSPLKNEPKPRSNYEKLVKPVKPDAPVKQWDEAPKKTTSWNGSNDKSVLTSLLSKNSQVDTWDNEASQTMRFEVERSSKRNRDRWDDEYDQGKVKKIKRQHSHGHSKSKGNPFQKMQNQRNYEKSER